MRRLGQVVRDPRIITFAIIAVAIMIVWATFAAADPPLRPTLNDKAEPTTTTSTTVATTPSTSESISIP
ncbi:MAG TPA: hypothetical protein VGJ86_10710 [Acidimicrobiales bacterium]|jgi:hypothetical protein